MARAPGESGLFVRWGVSGDGKGVILTLELFPYSHKVSSYLKNIEYAKNAGGRIAWIQKAYGKKLRW